MVPKYPALLSAIFLQLYKNNTRDKVNINCSGFSGISCTETAETLWIPSPTYIELPVQSKQWAARDEQYQFTFTKSLNGSSKAVLECLTRPTHETTRGQQSKDYPLSVLFLNKHKILMRIKVESSCAKVTKNINLGSIICQISLLVPITEIDAEVRTVSSASHPTTYPLLWVFMHMDPFQSY